MVAPRNQILHGDALTILRTLPDTYVQCVVTSPPYYGLRSYLPQEHVNKSLEIGTEETPYRYIAKLVEVFREVRRVLRPDGMIWLNLGDSYTGSGKGTDGKQEYLQGNIPRNSALVPDGMKPKSLMMLPARVAIALQEDGWILRNDIIWQKPNAMPESVTDRCTTSYEHVFLLATSPRYYFDAEAIREPARNWGTRDRSNGKYTSGIVPISGGKHGGFTNGNSAETGRNKRDIWTISPHPLSMAHFATMPPKLVEPCILAGSRPGDIVLDPFSGAGTVAMVAIAHHRDYLGIELNENYITLAEQRIAAVQTHLWDSTESEVSA